MTTIAMEKAVDLGTGAPLPLRSCVGIMMVNRFGQIWLGRRTPKWFADRDACVWQMPQGGIERGEGPSEAALRELYEETGAFNVEMIGEVPQWLTFELPPHLVGVALKGRYRGQRQRWFAMRFTGVDSEIDIRARKGRKAEFDGWRWAVPQEAVASAPAFKRPLYETVVAEFDPIVSSRADTWPQHA